MSAQNPAENMRVRVDKWLWAARFFKTRSLAAEAIGKNRIRVNGQKIKPSRCLMPGDTVQIEKPPYEFDITVRALNDQRRPAVEARQLYEETAASIEKRESVQIRLRADRIARLGLAGDGRPSKKQRRQIIRFQNRNSDD